MKSFPKNSCYASFKALFAQPVTYGVRISHHVLLLASIVWVLLLQGAQISSIGCLQFSKGREEETCQSLRTCFLLLNEGRRRV